MHVPSCSTGGDPLSRLSGLLGSVRVSVCNEELHPSSLQEPDDDEGDDPDDGSGSSMTKSPSQKTDEQEQPKHKQGKKRVGDKLLPQSKKLKIASAVQIQQVEPTVPKKPKLGNQQGDPPKKSKLGNQKGDGTGKDTSSVGCKFPADRASGSSDSDHEQVACVHSCACANRSLCLVLRLWAVRTRFESQGLVTCLL